MANWSANKLQADRNTIYIYRECSVLIGRSMCMMSSYRHAHLVLISSAAARPNCWVSVNAISHYKGCHEGPPRTCRILLSISIGTERVKPQQMGNSPMNLSPWTTRWNLTPVDTKASGPGPKPRPPPPCGPGRNTGHGWEVLKRTIKVSRAAIVDLQIGSTSRCWRRFVHLVKRTSRRPVAKIKLSVLRKLVKRGRGRKDMVDGDGWNSKHLVSQLGYEMFAVESGDPPGHWQAASWATPSSGQITPRGLSS